MKGEGGWAIVETLIAVPLILFILFAAVEYWGVLTVYRGAEEIKEYALSKMELSGGLTQADLTEVEDKLIKLGADPSSIRITGTILEDEKDAVLWPGEVRLRIEFVPEHFNGFAARTLIGGSPEPIRIGVEGSAISQKVEQGNSGGAGATASSVKKVKPKGAGAQSFK
ncbi:MAG: hypothetical protein ACPLTR_12370 [Thermacetogeniaceae bacterium]